MVYGSRRGVWAVYSFYIEAEADNYSIVTVRILQELL